MEEIIGLLVVLAAAIFKAVNKKLEKSGGQVPVVEPEPDPYPVSAPAPTPASTSSSAPVPAPKQQPAAERSMAQVRKTPVQTEVPEKKKEKIDPKKLIIYSEIMSPKCNE